MIPCRVSYTPIYALGVLYQTVVAFAKLDTLNREVNINFYNVFIKFYKFYVTGIRIFDSYLKEVSEQINSEHFKNISRSFAYDEKHIWPKAFRQIILKPDTAVELGPPEAESVSFLMWTDSLEKINDGQIRVIGPELNEVPEDQLSFGKIILVSGHGFDEDNSYKRYEEMDLIKFKLNLDGYMPRAIPQENKEWSRISKKALQSGFSLQVLGNELIRELKKLQYVDAAEIIFITSTKEDILKFKPVGKKVNKIIRAMNKMFDNLEYDCSNCDFSDVCNEVDDLKEMHQKAKQKLATEE